MNKRKTAGMLLVFLACVTVFLCLSGCGKTYKITVTQGEDLVGECPSRAAAGEQVRIETAMVTDAVIHVSVNGDSNYGAFARDGWYEFVMPPEDVEITVVVIAAYGMA